MKQKLNYKNLGWEMININYFFIEEKVTGDTRGLWGSDWKYTS